MMPCRVLSDSPRRIIVGSCAHPTGTENYIRVFPASFPNCHPYIPGVVSGYYMLFYGNAASRQL
jgi:hypothetical protein